MPPERSPSSERKPCGQGSGLVFRTPGPRNRLPERGQRGAELQLRPVKHFRRRGLKIAMAPGRARQLASSDGIFDDASEKLALEGMDPNVFVSDALRVDQAAHDNSNAPDPVTGVPVVPNHLGDRVPSEALHCGEQLRQLRTAASSGTEPGMVRLSRVRYGRVTSSIRRLSTTCGDAAAPPTSTALAQPDFTVKPIAARDGPGALFILIGAPCRSW